MGIIEEPLIETFETGGLVKIAMIFLIGTVVLVGMLNGSNISSNGSVQVTFTQNPNDGDTIQLDNHVYEFDNGDGVSAGNIQVQIESSMSGTVENWKTAASQYYNAE